MARVRIANGIAPEAKKASIPAPAPETQASTAWFAEVATRLMAVNIVTTETRFSISSRNSSPRAAHGTFSRGVRWGWNLALRTCIQRRLSRWLPIEAWFMQAVAPGDDCG